MNSSFTMMATFCDLVKSQDFIAKSDGSFATGICAEGTRRGIITMSAGQTAVDIHILATDGILVLCFVDSYSVALHKAAPAVAIVRYRA
jgi:hypothetical protein